MLELAWGGPPGPQGCCLTSHFQAETGSTLLGPNISLHVSTYGLFEGAAFVNSRKELTRCSFKAPLLHFIIHNYGYFLPFTQYVLNNQTIQKVTFLLLHLNVCIKLFYTLTIFPVPERVSSSFLPRSKNNHIMLNRAPKFPPR